jgi:hypothetical protein
VTQGVTQGVAQEAWVAEPRRQGARDRRLDPGCWNAPAGGTGGDARFDEFGGDVVAVAPAIATCMARPHLPALGVEEPAGQRARRPRRLPEAAADPVGCEPILHRLPEARVHDAGVLAGMDLVAMPDAADEDRIGEHAV